jgi:hypothetical protein
MNNINRGRGALLIACGGIVAIVGTLLAHRMLKRAATRALRKRVLRAAIDLAVAYRADCGPATPTFVASELREIASGYERELVLLAGQRRRRASDPRRRRPVVTTRRPAG